jgi:hypothetical protein
MWRDIRDVIGGVSDSYGIVSGSFPPNTATFN